MAFRDAETGEIIEVPQASETFERLPEPEIRRGFSLESDKVRKWRSRIDVARKIRSEKLKDLDKLIKFYEGKQWHIDNDMPVLKDRTTVNLIFSNIKKELPYLYFQNPTPIVNATRSEFELTAFALQELLKHYTKNDTRFRTELKKNVRLCILDAKFSFACLKAIYIPRFGINPRVGLPKLNGYDDFGQPIFVQNPDGSLQFEPNNIIASELYSLERISPREILIDPECRNFPEKAKWIGHEIVKPLSYLKDNELYKNTENLNRNIEICDVFEKTFNKTQEEITATRELADPVDTEQVRFVEIHDFENNELIVLPDNYNDFIREEKIYMNPFSFLKFNEKPDEFYPISDVAQEKPLQEEINVGRSLMITHARRSARKYAYTADTFRGVDELQGIESAKNPDDLTFFEISDFDQMPQPLAQAAQDPSVYQNLIQSKIDFNEVSSSTEAQRGMTERRKTKGESEYQEFHGQVRRTDKQSLVADFIVDGYEKLGKLIQATLTVPQAIKVIGPSGIFWTQVSGNDIQGEVYYDVEVSDMRPQIPEMEKQELSEYIFALSNFVNAVASNPIMMSVFNLQGLIKEFSKSFPSIKVENILNMQVTPKQIAQMVMMQMQQQRGRNAAV